VILDAPLLFEMGLDEICDKTIGVISDIESCIKRICIRDGISIEDAKARLKSQKSNEFFKMKCDYVINNEYDLEGQIDDIFEKKNLSNENVIEIKSKTGSYLQFRKLLEYSDRIEHCYTLKPLDFDMISPNNNGEENYKEICSELKIDVRNIYRPKQTHSNNVMNVNGEEAGIYTPKFQDVDGFITDRKEKVLSLSFADCTSLYFYAPVKNVIRKCSFWLEGYI
jgi:hypothetical protein